MDEASNRITEMTEQGEKHGDIFGIRPYGEAMNTLATGVVDGVGAFLKRVCLPAAEEFGLMLRDRVGAWRARNAVQIALKAEEMIKKLPNANTLQGHPRIVMDALSHGSWTDEDEVQNMWAGLLASSCSPQGNDESNLIFLNLLAQLTACQARILKYSCEKCEKEVTEGGWISARQVRLNVASLKKLTGILDFHRLDRELDHLRALGLLGAYEGGFGKASRQADVTPTGLALQMYVRCCGESGSPVTFFGLEEILNEGS